MERNKCCLELEAEKKALEDEVTRLNQLVKDLEERNLEDNTDKVNAFDEQDKLLAENAKLKEERSELVINIARNKENRERLEAEVARLKEALKKLDRYDLGSHSNIFLNNIIKEALHP